MRQLIGYLLIMILVSTILSFVVPPGPQTNLVAGYADTANKPTAPKEFTVTISHPIEQWNTVYMGLNFVINELRNSDRPAKNVAFATDSILGPLQQQIFLQLQKQMRQDTVGKKPK